MASTNKKILIVDDEFFLAELIKTRLEASHYDAEIAENGEAGIEMLKKDQFDLILLDVMMPVMDGWEAAKIIKSDEKLKQIPVIFLTALTRHEDHLKAHESGGDDYISKPFEAEDLLAKVKKWTEQK